jgi:ABC-type uncharacterized transport system fused permease/ATPase subunit
MEAQTFGHVESPHYLGRPIESLEPSDQGSNRLRRRLLLRRFWRGAIGFWGAGGDRLCWVLPGTILLTVCLSLTASYGMNLWNRAIFDALERRDATTVLYWSIGYFPLLAVSVCVVVLQVNSRMTMQRRWRAWLNNHLLDRWLTNGRYYQLNLVGGDHKNPEYRIAEDVRIATEAPVEFATGITTAVLSAVMFIIVLWTIGGALSFNLGGITITIPGFLVIAAVLYAAFASGAMAFIGRRFVIVSESKNQAEAEYRYVLTRLSENGESIAVLGGEQEERSAVDRSLTTVLRRWRDICTQTMRTTFVSQTSGYVAPVLPIILCAPKFLEGSMSLGEVMQAASAFTIVQFAFNWLVDNYPRLADWTASARRVSSLMVSLDALERAEQGVDRIERSETAGAALRLAHLSVTLEDGTAVVKDAEIVIAPGERVLVAGEFGTGKSDCRLMALGSRPCRGCGRRENAHGAATCLRSGRHIAEGRHLSAAGRGQGSRSGRKGVEARRPPSLGRPHWRSSALGPNIIRRREAEAGIRANSSASAQHCRARRGDIRARSCQPGPAHGAPDDGARCNHHCQRCAPAGAGGVPQPQDHARASERGCAVRDRHRAAPWAEPRSPHQTLASCPGSRHAKGRAP